MEKIDFKNLNNKSKIEIAITSVFILIFILTLNKNIKTIFKSRQPNKESYLSSEVLSEAVVPSPPVFTASMQTVSGKEEISRKSEDMQWGRDPFSIDGFLKSSQNSLSKLKLEGIVWDEIQPYVVIGGEVVKEGDKIGENVIIKIDQDSITISDGTKNYKLQL